MTKVVLKANEPVDVALRRFRREIQKTGLIQELRARGAYEKPTAERKRSIQAACPAQARHASTEAVLRNTIWKSGNSLVERTSR